MIREARGFTIVELLVTMFFLSVFTLAMQQFCAVMLRGARVLEASSEAQESARLGVQLIVAAAREAGFSPAGALPDGIRRAGPGLLEIARDLNGDGDVADANELVSFQYVPASHELLQALGGAAPQPLLDDVDENGVAFSYFAADGTPLIGDAGELDATQRARVRRIDVRLSMAIPNPDPAYIQPLRAEASATAALRNAP
jgi:type II secretory pathway component PulJ